LAPPQVPNEFESYAIVNARDLAFDPHDLLQCDSVRCRMWDGLTGPVMSQAESRTLSPDDVRRAAWMMAAQAGDRLAYEALLRDCVPLIESVARRQGVPAGLVDDAVQETLLTVHRARQAYDPARSFTAWLRVIAERRAIDVLRRTGRHAAREVHAPLAYESHPDQSDAIQRASDGRDASRNLGDVVASLPVRQREAVQHLVLQERTLAETALATGRTTGSLKVNLHRALKTLRARLGQAG
jgi:RNA polymerase sigma factor (sigma-70 family)